MKTLHSAEVPSELAGERLDKALAALFPELSRGAARRHIEAGAVCVDGRPVRSCSRTVRPRSLVEVGAPPVAAPPAPVLHADGWLVIIDKPTGLLSQPGRDRSQPSALDAVPSELAGPRPLHVVHRLDRGASGALALARGPRAAAAVSDAIRRGAVHRRYVALVCGVCEGDDGAVDLALRHDRRRNRAQVDPSGKPARTRWRVLDRRPDDGLSKVELVLETGRSHQIRAHMAATLGPLLGDTKYGGRPADRLYLHADRLELPHPANGDPLTVDAPAPF